jgi:hypothetical protein
MKRAAPVLLALLVAAAFGRAVAMAGTTREARPAFPLRVSDSKRYLVDARGRPFLLHGDSPWEIAWQLTREEAEELLDNRAAKGFNAILVDVLPYSEWSPYLTETDRYGHGPFLTPGDFSTPNEAYFAHLDWLVRAAEKRGILVLFVCADLGSPGDRPPASGAKQGMWHEQYLSNGIEKCYQYGRYLGRRYRHFPNVLWVLGGDRDPGDVIEHVRAMARGLEETDPDHLKTYHAGAKNGSLFFRNDAWFDISMSYGYTEPYGFVGEDYRAEPVKPCFMGESGYEGEANDRRPGTPQRVRRQAYWAMLAGACGHLYGSAAWTVQPDVWRKWLDSPGAQHMAHFGRLFRSLEWFRLVPDAAHEILVAGLGEAGTPEYATCAATPDGVLAVCYLPTARPVTVDLSRLKGPVEARWFDPTSGEYTTVEGSPLAGAGRREFTPPARNSAGDSDVVLVLETAR